MCRVYELESARVIVTALGLGLGGRMKESASPSLPFIHGVLGVTGLVGSVTPSEVDNKPGDANGEWKNADGGGDTPWVAYFDSSTGARSCDVLSAALGDLRRTMTGGGRRELDGVELIPLIVLWDISVGEGSAAAAECEAICRIGRSDPRLSGAGICRVRPGSASTSVCPLFKSSRLGILRRGGFEVEGASC